MSNSQKNLRLCYFNGRGLAETSRLLLVATNTQYEDFRYPLEIIDWKTYNFRRDEFNTAVEAGDLKLSLNKVPYLVVGESVICQSKAIERYIARITNTMGSNELEAAKIDSICEWVIDLKTAYKNVKKLPEEEREGGLTKWFSETLPEKMTLLDALVSPTYSIGNKLSLADITLFSFVTQFFDNVEGAKASLANAPNIASVVETVETLPSIQSWINTRPDTPF